jgi:hypothetical protein
MGRLLEIFRVVVWAVSFNLIIILLSSEPSTWV